MPALNVQKSPLPLNGHRSVFGRLLDLLPSWKPTSEDKLEQAESNVLKHLQSDYQDIFVPISSDAVIRTLTLTSKSSREVPLVMIHGFGAGLLQFYKNLDHLHSERSVHALDLPGFGRSTRKPFPLHPDNAEQEFVDYLEVWRKAMRLEKFVLLGHSFGAYIACAYTLRYPERVRHLILVDPWGFAQPPNEQELNDKFKQSSWFWRAVGKLKPFTVVRTMGPWGPTVIKRMRADLVNTFSEEFLDYVYHCNAQKPTGEMAYNAMQYYFAWSQRPMLSRVASSLCLSVPLTVVCGRNSWLRRLEDKTPEKIAQARHDSYVAVHYVEGAGHHVHADQPAEFNQIVSATLKLVDTDQDIATDSNPSSK